ncbi:MAG TPA: hypothetical protein VFS20_04895 [Longimicrobium sp.]|nr:hypothetical protein [Longimicrobium sp.]
MSEPPPPTDVLLSGQLITPLPPAELAAALCGVGMEAEARESSLYWGGIYVRLYVGDEVDFTLEHVEPTEYMARADADHVDSLKSVAGEVSAALARIPIRHRFEVYDARDTMVLYLHHDWPEEES